MAAEITPITRSDRELLEDIHRLLTELDGALRGLAAAFDTGGARGARAALRRMR